MRSIPCDLDIIKSYPNTRRSSLSAVLIVQRGKKKLIAKRIGCGRNRQVLERF